MISAALQEASGIRFTDLPNKSLRLADTFEARLLRDGWPVGFVLGSEARLAQEHDVANQVVRQALRVMEWRGLGRMRRGEAGGLVIHTPATQVTGRLLALHLAATGVEVADVQEARAFLLKELPFAAAAARGIIVSLLDAVQDAMSVAPDASATAAMDNRAMRIAQRLIGTMRRQRQDERIGTLDVLAETYSAGRPIIVQAVRILEDLELARAARGRGGGLERRQPSPAAIVKTVNAHFAARRLSVNAAVEVMWAINRISARRGAETSAGDRALEHLRDSAAIEAFADGDLSPQIAIFKHLADLSALPVLHLLVRCLWYYKERFAPTPSSFSDTALRCIQRSTVAIVDEVRAGRADRANAAVCDCEQRSSDLWIEASYLQ